MMIDQGFYQMNDVVLAGAGRAIASLCSIIALLSAWLGTSTVLSTTALVSGDRHPVPRLCCAMYVSMAARSYVLPSAAITGSTIRSCRQAMVFALGTPHKGRTMVIGHSNSRRSTPPSCCAGGSTEAGGTPATPVGGSTAVRMVVMDD